jgi:nitrite reductase/ring-hydroxylating ferredoxin subunit
MKRIVGLAEEIPIGGRKIVEVEGVSVGIFNVGGEFFALRNRCPHQGGPLCEGKRWGTVEARIPGDIQYHDDGEIIACPWHGWEFVIRTGQSRCDPRRLRTRRYPVHVESGAELVEEEDIDFSTSTERVDGPYKAERIPVSREGRYLVVEIESRIPA